ncbi:MAG TPA: FAD-dependent oxidoreductase [Candidatus Acidoferrales bacterium]|nr:FAD-dependent oxidoreductase [Candidatus Acidoferrales bacterium]
MASPAKSRPKLARVNVAPNRVIRSIAGLRPFRASGFVVRGEKLDAKTVVHNYGHGGAGITLSWGTAQLAVEEGAKSGARDCAVIGCGVVGLSTARLLQMRGYSPVIYAKAMPPETTSNVAGGLWEPTTVFDRGQSSETFRKQFPEAARFAFRRYQSLTGDLYGVRWLSLYTLSANSEYMPPSGDSPYVEIEKLYPESQILRQGEHPFHAPYAHRRQTMLIEPAIYLNALVRDFFLAGGRIVVREFASIREIAALKEDLIFNCTGLGARDLFGDQELTPIRGQLAFLLPQPEVDYCTIGPGNIYMFPRRDGILLGGTFDRGVSTTEPDPAITERIVRDNAELFAKMRG